MLEIFRKSKGIFILIVQDIEVRIRRRTRGTVLMRLNEYGQVGRQNFIKYYLYYILLSILLSIYWHLRAYFLFSA